MIETAVRVLIAALGTVALLPTSALACTPAIACRTLQSARPLDGATDVPRNVELRVWYGSPGPAVSARPVLETDAGEVVTTSWEIGQLANTEAWVGHPATPLAPSTHYRLRHPFVPCSQTDAGPLYPAYCEGLCTAEVGDVISEFTTAASSDERALAAPVLGTQLEMRPDVCTGAGCCGGPYTGCFVRVDLPSLAAGQSFRVDRDGQFLGFVSAKPSLEVTVGGPLISSDLRGAGDYQVSVVDATGNRSPSTTLTIPACEVVEDGGAADASIPADASIRHDASAMSDASVNPRGGDGCALGEPRGSFALSLALLLARRRRA